jgi:hypothetical protein
MFLIQSHTDALKLSIRAAKEEDLAMAVAEDTSSQKDESDAKMSGISTEATANNAASAPHPVSKHNTEAISKPDGGGGNFL